MPKSILLQTKEKRVHEWLIFIEASSLLVNYKF